MGQCKSKPSYIASSNGGEREFRERFLVSEKLGQGEFGLVKLAHDVKNGGLVGGKPFAVKHVKKSYTFKDNTLYTPLKKEVLQGEVEILQRLNGECFNLNLVAVYESPSTIYIVTEYCEGGEMMPWISRAFQDAGGLRTDDVSRISYQLWSAVNHCAKHGVIHRDIKPENVMFCTAEKHSQLRLIDFGSGTLDAPENPEANGNGEVENHHTFAGSAFYISPEMFQRSYTAKTDVWSAGVTLYVLAAGYPAAQLQKAFNILQSAKEGRLRELPDLPNNMPESFHEMLEGALVYRHKQRVDAGRLMMGQFSQFHMHQEGIERLGESGAASANENATEIADELADEVPEMAPGLFGRRTTSVLLEGSVERHNAYLGYQKFERSLTTVLATMLSKDTSRGLLKLLEEQHHQAGETNRVGSGHHTEMNDKDSHRIVSDHVGEGGSNEVGEGGSNEEVNAEKLQVVTVKVLLQVLADMQVEDPREVEDVIDMIKSLQNFGFYENFAYHISLLRQFVSIRASAGSRAGGGGAGDSMDASTRSVRVWRSLSRRAGGRGGDADSSTKSTASFRSAGGIRRTLGGMSQGL